MIKWRLRVVMAERGIKNITLANAVGVDRRVISRWRRVGYVPRRLDTALLGKICEALDCGVGDLLVFLPGSRFP